MNYICGCPVGARACSNTLIHGRTQSKRRGPREQAMSASQRGREAAARGERPNTLADMINGLFDVSTSYSTHGIAPVMPVAPRPAPAVQRRPAARRAPAAPRPAARRPVTLEEPRWRPETADERERQEANARWAAIELDMRLTESLTAIGVLKK